jgi:hypothetical protein
MKPKIIYCYDAYCGWCYGFSAVINKIWGKYKENIDFETFNFIQEKLFLPNNKFYIKLEKNKKFFYFYIIHYFFLLLEKKKFIVKKNIEKLINFYNHQKKKKCLNLMNFFFQ